MDDPAVAHDSGPYRAAVDRSYSRAVNAVADLWYSLLLRVPLDCGKIPGAAPHAGEA